MKLKAWNIVLLGTLTLGSLPAMAVKPVCETPGVKTKEGYKKEGQADDVAIWVHPTDAKKSRVIAAVKGAGVYVYDLQCKLVQSNLNKKENDDLDIEYINNLDLRYNVPWGDKTIDLVVGADEKAKQLFFFKVDGSGKVSQLDQPKKLDRANDLPKLKNFTHHGLCLYRHRGQGALHIIATQEVPGMAVQWVLGNDGGKPTIQRVRQISFGDDSVIEPCVADDQLGYLYVGEEQKGIWKFPALPVPAADGDYAMKSKEAGAIIKDGFVDTKGNDAKKVLKGTVEGLAIYYGAGNSGYLLANNEGANSTVIFARNGNNAYQGTFKSTSTSRIDTIESPDGLDVANINFGGKFAHGLFISHDDENSGGRKGANFKFFSWKDIADATGVKIDTSGDPRRR